MKVCRDIDADEDCEPVIVPRNDEVLVAVAPERVRRLREHLVGTLREMRTAKPGVQSVSPALPDPTGFPARVAQTACSLCKGWCCRNGDDNGFLDEPRSTPRGCNGSVAPSIQTMSAPRHSLRSCTASPRSRPADHQPASTADPRSSPDGTDPRPVYLVLRGGNSVPPTVPTSLMLKDLTFIASQCRCSARVYSGSAGRTASNAMTLATPGRGPLPAPFVVTLLSAGRLFFVSTLGQPPMNEKPCLTRHAWISRLHPAQRNHA